MKMKLHLLLLAIMVFLSSATLSAQKILHKANKQYELKHYHEAIDSYIKTLKQYPDNLEAKSNLAECYRMTNQLTLAEEAYSKIMPEEFLDPIHIRNYGVTLMKMAKYTQAHYQFELYKIYNPQDAQHYQLSCEFAHHLFRTERAYNIELVDVNTPNSDFGVAFSNDQLIFSSFRNDVEFSDDAKKTGQKLTGNMLYTADLGEDLRASNVRFLRSGIAEKKNIGPITYATKAQKCAFTRNRIQDGGAHVTGDDSYHSIYIADLNADGTWDNERPFRYNEFGTSSGFPCLAFDGSALYFASNRVGGFGGYDIYVSYWKENSWTYPQNLGEDINTAGNEITPYFTGEDLYFASDYHHGMGGYDIFHSLVKGGKWTHPENMANGLNSPADDYYPVIKKDTEGIFFSSNRLGGKGMDDIYLAIPVEVGDYAVIEDFVPNAVALTEMSSEVDKFISQNEFAKAVSQDNGIEVKILNPTDENKAGVTDLDAGTQAEEELPMWGFAKSDETIQTSSKDKSRLVSIPQIEKPSISLKEDVSSRYSGKDMRIQISFVPGESALSRYLAAIEIEEEMNLLEDKTSKIENEGEESNMAQVETPAAFKLPNYEAISANRAPFNLDLAGAKRVAIGEILPASNVYFIQLAAFSKSTGNVSQFAGLSKYGNLYKVFISSSTKIKLGYFLDKEEAKNVLKNVKAHGYNDAFITKDDLGDLQLELIVANENQNTSYTSYDSSTESSKENSSQQNAGEYSLNNKGKNSYKIRLASYEDPIWFDIDKAKSLGKIEQWTKGDWTIFILGGYDTHENAEKARVKAINKGFVDAEIVIDNNGILERLRQN